MKLIGSIDGDGQVCLLVTNQGKTPMTALGRVFDRTNRTLGEEQRVGAILSMGRTFEEWAGGDEERKKIEAEAEASVSSG